MIRNPHFAMNHIMENPHIIRTIHYKPSKFLSSGMMVCLFLSDIWGRSTSGNLSSRIVGTFHIWDRQLYSIPKASISEREALTPHADNWGPFH